MALAIPHGEVRAQSETPFGDVDPGLADAAYLGIVLPIELGLGLLPTRPNPDQDPPGFDLSARDHLRWDNTVAARRVSDIFLYSEMAVAVGAGPLFEWSVDTPELSASLVATEALATTALVTTVFKHLAGRQRPYAYAAGREEGFRSFFSGHASMTFASATLLTAFAYEYDWLSDSTRWIVPASAYAVAAFTGYLRIAGDVHWLSDVLVGAAVGTGTSYLVFAIRTGS